MAKRVMALIFTVRFVRFNVRQHGKGYADVNFEADTDSREDGQRSTQPSYPE
jgi:hypothetical protein